MMAALDYVDSYYRRNRTRELPSEPLEGDIEAPVCVIGGGLAGIATALGLAERGVDAVVLEANRVGWGASGRNGGFVSAGFSQSATKLVEQLGENHAVSLYELSREGFNLVRERAIAFASEDTGEGDGAVMQPGSGSLTVSWFDDPDGVQAYVDVMNNTFGENFEFWPRERVRESYLTKRYYDGFFKPDTLRFNSLNYALATAARAVALGARVYEQSPVTRVNKTENDWVVEAATGRVKADTVVYACSGYIGGLEPRLARATLPVATYILLTEPLGDRLESAVRADYAVSDNRFSSNYYRIVGDRQLLWGGRVSMFHPQGKALERLMLGDLLSVYPQLEGVKGEVAWGGHMGYARHKMPQIGRLPNGAWYCQGFGGHGMATTTMGGEVVASAIADGDTRYELFAPFGLDYVGRPFGPVITQLAYWGYQLQDALQVSQLNRKF